MSRALKLYVKSPWYVVIDRAVNALLGGSFYETLSSRAHRSDVKNHPYWGWTAAAINTLFFWQPDHCKVQWEYEQTHTYRKPE